MIKILEELSQILAVIGISTSQEEKILTSVKNLFASPKDIEEPKFHVPHPCEDIEAFCNHPFRPIEETK
jgi:hypothetical protein